MVLTARFLSLAVSAVLLSAIPFASVMAGDLPRPIADLQPATPEGVLKAGFQAIADRYIRPVSLLQFVGEGLQGLSRLDSDLAVIVTAGGLTLTYRGTAFHEYISPESDPGQWAVLVDRIVEDARTVSIRLSRASPAAVCRAIFDRALGSLDEHSRYYPAAAGNAVGVPNSGRSTPRGGDLSEPSFFDVDSSSGLRSVQSKFASSGVRGEIESGIALITISRFTNGTAGRVQELVGRAATMPGFRGLILDLRGNPGGPIDEAVLTAQRFLGSGVIVTTSGRTQDANRSFEGNSPVPKEEAPLVVLIDGQSASAAEVLAAALQDRGRAVLIGTTSFGKGTVQAVIPLPEEVTLTLTVARFYSPSGYPIDGLGVLPNVCTVAPSPGRSVFEAWRRVTVDDITTRQKLRLACPASSRAGANGDLAIARSLLNDSPGYARVLAEGRP